MNGWGSVYLDATDRVCDVKLTEPFIKVHGFDFVLLVGKEGRRLCCKMTSQMETPVDYNEHVHSVSLLGLVCNY